MKTRNSFSRIRRSAAIAGTVLMVSAGPATADLKEAINTRDELNAFQAFLERTGTKAMLDQGTYTVFAPVNQAFNSLPKTKYPYLYSTGYPGYADMARDIARNHIVSGAVYLPHDVDRKGGVFSVDNRFIPIAEGAKNDYFVDGHRVLSTRMMGDDILYVIDGVIAKPWEMTEIIPVPAATVAGGAGDTTILVPENSQVVLEEELAPGQSRTTTIITH